jgi:hypothetical protein
MLLPCNRSFEAVKLARSDIANNSEDGRHLLRINSTFDPGKDDVLDWLQSFRRTVVQSFAFPISIESLNESQEERKGSIKQTRRPLKLRSPIFLVDRKAIDPEPAPDVVEAVLLLEERTRRSDLGTGAFRIEHNASAICLLVLDGVWQQPLAPPAPDSIHPCQSQRGPHRPQLGFLGPKRRQSRSP